MNNLTLKIFSRLQLAFGSVDYRLEQVETGPQNADIPPNTVIVIGHRKLPKRAVMRCPCGCGEILNLSLREKIKPNWSYEIDGWGKITLAPSVWKNDGCRSHFFLKKGKIKWCN